MAWTLTDDVDAYAAAVGPLLHADPLRHSVSLTTIDALRSGRTLSSQPSLFGWDTAADGTVAAAFHHTPPFPLLLAVAPPTSLAPLVDALVGRSHAHHVVTGPSVATRGYADAWAARTGGTVEVDGGRRLFVLGELRPPVPVPAGRARRAVTADTDLLLDWLAAFDLEAHGQAHDPAGVVAARLRAGYLWLWEDGGEPVALAGRHAPSAGMVRIGPVYTPLAQRGHGYGAAVTAAATAAALDAGATGVCLFTDIASAVPNRLYPRLGFRPVEERAELRLVPPTPAPTTAWA